MSFFEPCRHYRSVACGHGAFRGLSFDLLQSALRYQSRYDATRSGRPITPDIMPARITATAGVEIVSDINLRDLPQWFNLLGLCAACGRVGGINRYDLGKRRGMLWPLKEWESKLRCKGCDNRRGNKFGVRKMPR